MINREKLESRIIAAMSVRSKNIEFGWYRRTHNKNIVVSDGLKENASGGMGPKVHGGPGGCTVVPRIQLDVTRSRFILER